MHGAQCVLIEVSTKIQLNISMLSLMNFIKASLTSNSWYFDFNVLSNPLLILRSAFYHIFLYDCANVKYTFQTDFTLLIVYIHSNIPVNFWVASMSIWISKIFLRNTENAWKYVEKRELLKVYKAALEYRNLTNPFHCKRLAFHSKSLYFM